MRGSTKTLTYLFIFLVFTLESLYTAAHFLHPAYLENGLFSSVPFRLFSLSCNELHFLRSPAAFLLSFLCLLKLINIFFSKRNTSSIVQ